MARKSTDPILMTELALALKLPTPEAAAEHARGRGVELTPNELGVATVTLAEAKKLLADHQTARETAAADGSAGSSSSHSAAVAAVLTVLRARNVVVGGTGAPAFIFDEDTFALKAAAIANVTGGTTVDAEARVALNAALIALRSAGFIAED